MTLRILALGMLPLIACGCSEGVKANPLPRAGAPTDLPAPIADKNASGKTLYERLGREFGLTQTVDQLVKDLDGEPKSKALAAKLKKRILVEFLMEVSSNPRSRLADDVLISSADWTLLLPALQSTLNARGVADADRDELLAKIEKSR